MMRLLIVAIIFSLSNLSCKSPNTVDTIVLNGVVYTVSEKFETVQAFAIKDGKIIATGTDAAITSNYTAKEIIDAKGQAVYPGFIDAHAHFLGYGQSLFMVDLFGAASWEEVVERVKRFAKEHPEEKWVKGRGWDQNKWADKSYPTNEKLNEAFPTIPVILTRVDGHAAVVNQKAFDIAAIHGGQTLAGGEIETRNGKLTGVLIDNAVDLVTSKMPGSTVNDYVKWLSKAEKNCFKVGLTTVADCGLMYSDVQTIDGLQKEGKLNMRLYVMLSDDTANYQRYLNKEPYKSDRMFVKGIKVYADGALGSRGACLLEPYADKKGWSGFLLKDKTYFDSIAKVISKTAYQMCTHAIGDSANREILKIYNRALNGANDKRWRIEHAQVINPADFGMFGKSNIIPSVQPTHATSDMYWAAERLGLRRIKGGYAFKQLLHQNGWIPLGTDFPVEDISPFKTFLAAVFRKDAKGFPEGGFQVENALTREETIKGMTIWAARACFLENEVGSIETGKKADFIVLNKDLMKIGENDVLNTKVVMTYIGGKRVL
ncbi:amidohydrolase [Segetibacter sp.]|jgi:predicted amidohydrolase YtcJ|uniref:amidohydrolase n=1 Tax=Segetibacter sp. TaxID=2231182 RepID=UPI00260CCB87|nr:amidohydrolase [Segetibacter sp.]